jgi:hypothetical protein
MKTKMKEIQMGFVNKHIFAIAVLAVIATGCASIKGSVSRIDGGQYKSFASHKEKTEALKIADNDTRVTCKKADGKEPIVIKQDTKLVKPEKSGMNKWAAAAMGVQQKDATYDVTTIFKCVK